MEFNQNKSGIHIMSTLNPEYTLCGLACEGTECVDGDETPLKKIDGFHIVTCRECKREIQEISEYLVACRKTRQTKKGEKYAKIRWIVGR
jgi:hypothetical protein